MRLSQEGRQDVRGLEVVVVAGPVEVRGLAGDVARAVLPPVGLDELQPGDLGNGVPLVRLLEWTREECLLVDRLRRVLGVDAGGAEEDKALDAGLVGGVDDVRLDHQVVVEERRGARGVRRDAADFRSREEDDVRAVGLDPGRGRRLLPEVDGAAGEVEEFAVLGGQAADEGRAHHAVLARDPDAFS